MRKFNLQSVAIKVNLFLPFSIIIRLILNKLSDWTLGWGRSFNNEIQGGFNLATKKCKSRYQKYHLAFKGASTQ